MRRASKRASSNTLIIPDLSNGKGARSPKCCDRGIMRRSPPWDKRGRRQRYGEGRGTSTLAGGAREGDRAKKGAGRKARAAAGTRLRPPDLSERHGAARRPPPSGAQRE